ncbi:hypothetical protein P171DRAFT_453601 [Karstenula rhodostoma CBS 690.94]|uniref:Uncharacterized protein n=1 Tax=Karstenula rhodostoma CBS 690.94 TaxID=1392251 RepID=A0A9P4PLD3_9PLEO|nr:hypothetical protein P171DRAFT_453601 [Karstenula rhodostoma CBS 690.94]
MSGINMVKFFFLKGTMPRNQSEIQRVTTLAYQTARAHNLYPKQILIRGPGHATTTIGGKLQPDPNGNHFTFCYKSEQQVQTQTHIACHGYTPGPADYTLTKATFAAEKLDSIPKKRNNKPVWPAETDLDVGLEIGYQH